MATDDIKKRDHEIHARRKNSNFSIGMILGAFVVLVFIITVVKMTQGQMMEGFDHAVRPSLLEADK